MSNASWSACVNATLTVGVFAQGQPEAGANPSTQSLGGPAPQAAVPSVGTASQPNTNAANPATGTGTGPQGPSMMPFMLVMIAMVGFMVFTSWRQGKAEKKKRQDLMDNLSKGDEVQTIGGMVGIVTDIREQAVVVKFEEGKARFLKTAIVSISKSARAKDGAPAAIETKDSRRETANN